VQQAEFVDYVCVQQAALADQLEELVLVVARHA
jgi:hypothetical protein